MLTNWAGSWRQAWRKKVRRKCTTTANPLGRRNCVFETGFNRNWTGKKLQDWNGSTDGSDYSRFLGSMDLDMDGALAMMPKFFANGHFTLGDTKKEWTRGIQKNGRRILGARWMLCPTSGRIETEAVRADQMLSRCIAWEGTAGSKERRRQKGNMVDVSINAPWQCRKVSTVTQLSFKRKCSPMPRRLIR